MKKISAVKAATWQGHGRAASNPWRWRGVGPATAGKATKHQQLGGDHHSVDQEHSINSVRRAALPLSLLVIEGEANVVLPA